MLQHIVQASRKSVLPFTLLALTAALAACGGGGSGGGGSAPQKFTIVAPIANKEVETDEQVIITFIDAIDTSAVIKLNGIDVSSIFTVDTATNSIKASIYALQGILAAQSAKSTLTVSATGARTQTVQFSLNAKPELVLTKSDDPKDPNDPSKKIPYIYGVVQGGSGQGYCDEFDPADPAACVGNGGNIYVPSLLDNNLNFRVAVRNGSIDSLSLNYGLGLGAEVNNAAGSNKNKLFNVTGVSYLLDSAGYSFQNNDTELLNIAVPGQLIESQIAAQVSSLGTDHVVSRWVAEALNEAIESINERTEPLVLMEAKGTANTEGNKDVACELLNRIVGAGTYYKCKLELIGIGVYDNTTSRTPLNFNVSADIKPLPATGTPFESGWQLQFLATTETRIDVKVRVTAYQGSTNDTAGYVQAIVPILGDGGARTFPEIGFKLNIGSNQTAEILAMHFPMKTLAGELVQDALSVSQSIGVIESSVQTTKLENCFSGECVPVTGVTIPSSVAGPSVDSAVTSITDLLVACMQPYSFDGGEFDAADKTRCRFDEIPDPLHITATETTQPIGVADNYFSAVTASVEQANYLATTGNGGFFAINGTQKIRNDGVHLNALGAKSVTSSSGKVASQLISLPANHDMALALSANWFNQILLSVYQSNAISQVEMTDEIANLGELGDYLVSMGQGIIKDTDEVTISVALDAVPSMRFLDDHSELFIADARMRVELSSSCAGTLATCAPLSDSGKPYIDLTMDIKARLSPTSEAGKIVAFEKDDLMLYISEASGTKVTVPILGTVFNPKAEEFYGLMLPVVNDLLDEQLGGLFQPLKYDFTVGNLCNNSALSSVLTNFFAGGRSLSLLLKDLYFDTRNSSGEAEHVIAQGQVVETDNVTVLDTPIFQLTVNYGAASTCP